MITLTHVFLQLILEGILFFSYPLISALNFLFNDRISYPKSSTGKTVVIVERWFHKNIFHLYWKHYLESKGLRVYLIFHPLGKGTFFQSASKLRTFIKNENLSNITLVGISSGGISSLLYLQDMDGWERVSTFISIGSPFKGTPMALPLVLNRSCRELLPWSNTIKKIKNNNFQNKNDIICLVPKLDEVVPVINAALPGVRKQKIDAYGHNYLHMLCRETYDVIAHYANKNTNPS